jgi:hypothetical protein
MNNINKCLLKSEVDYQRNLETSSSRTWIRQSTSRRESTDRPTPPLNFSLTLYLTISIHKTCQVSKYPGYPKRGKIQHPARLLKKLIVGDPKSTNNASAAQDADDKLYLAQALRRGIRHDRSLGRHLSASPEPPWFHQRRPTPRGAFLPCPRDMWNPKERRGATGAPNYGTCSHRHDGRDRT